MFREIQTVPLLGTLQSFPMPTHESQSIKFAPQCFVNDFNRTILQLFQLGGGEIRVMTCLRPVVCTIKSLRLFQIGDADLAQMYWAFFFVLRPISRLTLRTTIKFGLAGTAFVGTRLVTSRTSTGFHDLIRHDTRICVKVKKKKKKKKSFSSRRPPQINPTSSGALVVAFLLCKCSRHRTEQSGELPFDRETWFLLT